MNVQFFVPDISGFSSFVNETEIEHGQLITKELLETIIDSNKLEMEIYEIEGDAIFFYTRKGNVLPEELFASSRKILNEFRGKRVTLDKNRKCKCGACSSISNLSLKFFVHEDTIDEIKIKHFTKFYGKGLIILHLLMKNTIPENEYLLLTDAYLKKFETPKIDNMEKYTYDSNLFGAINVKFVKF